MELNSGVSRPLSLGGGVNVVVVLLVSYISNSRSLAAAELAAVGSSLSAGSWAEWDRLMVSVEVFTK